MDRHLLAYILLALVFCAIGALVLFLRYHGHERTYRRQRERDLKAHRASMAEKQEEPKD